ncbi:PREDICTED: olfactory receptor 5V1-like [Thamnophis sirtalis]|uniref:Olfactory receptor 5V1-like n=1 Tax=Thamnophis sirtalis TaxID=35019 RepID=A0A6I9XRL5_9SAUR|nr:PREDICTED: olfactory receptor 5V1-like [Thamnophis sirtalis]
MAYDQYIAIHDPLHYIKTMNALFCKQLVGSAWTTGLLYAIANTVPVLKLVFCGPNIIRHFSCEFPSLLALSCTETTASKIMFYVTSAIVGMFTFSLTLVSYVNIFITILKMKLAEARKKTFSTCSSHLIVMALFYVTGYFQYLRPNSISSVVMDELFSVQYSISTPMLNPIIYSLKTKKVREAIKQLLNFKQINQ